MLDSVFFFFAYSFFVRDCTIWSCKTRGTGCLIWNSPILFIFGIGAGKRGKSNIVLKIFLKKFLETFDSWLGWAVNIGLLIKKNGNIWIFKKKEPCYKSCCGLWWKCRYYYYALYWNFSNMGSKTFIVKVQLWSQKFFKRNSVKEIYLG